MICITFLFTFVLNCCMDGNENEVRKAAGRGDAASEVTTASGGLETH